MAFSFGDFTWCKIRHRLTLIVRCLATNLFWYFVTVRHFVSLAFLAWNFLTPRHCHVMAFLFWNVLAVFSVVVGRLALLAVVRGALLLLLLAALLFVLHVALHLLLVLATVSRDGQQQIERGNNDYLLQAFSGHCYNDFSRSSNKAFSVLCFRAFSGSRLQVVHLLAHPDLTNDQS